MLESNVIYHAFQEIEETEKSYQHHLRGNGGGGTFDGMEARVAKLESSVEHIQKDVTEIKVDIRDTKKDVQKIEVTLAKIRGESVLIRWMLGLTVAGIISLIIKSFFGG